MREIDDAHHAEDDGESARAQHEKRDGVAELIEEAYDQVEHKATCRGNE